MKSVEQVIAAVRDHLEADWHLELTGSDDSNWPRSYPLSAPASSAAGAMTTTVRNWAWKWHDYAASVPALNLAVKNRKINEVSESLPTHLTVPDIDTAASIVGAPWPDRLRIARLRLDILRSEFPETTSAQVLRLTGRLNDVDFDLARVAARWFADREPAEWEHLTPRQVPVEGLHGKWLNSHRPLVQALAGLDSLNLRQRPTRINFTYLDPGYRQSGHRIHDSHTLTDHCDLPYRPRIVVIAENKDTAILFPELADAIAVEGNGNASVGLLPQLPWIAGADQLIYWGDMDARGYEILNGLRKFGLAVRTILMDQADYETYEKFGTNTEPKGKPIKRRTRLDLRELTDAEREVYHNLTDPDWNRYLRVEQERIPLEVALARVLDPGARDEGTTARQ